MRKNTFLFAAALAAVSINALADEPLKLTYKGDAEKTDKYSVWDIMTRSWEKPIGATAIPAMWQNNSIAVFNGKGVNDVTVADSIQIKGEITCAGIEISGDKDYYVTKDADSDKLMGAGALIKEGTGDFILSEVPNSMEGGTIVRSGRVYARKDNPNSFGPKIVLENGGVVFAEQSSSNKDNGIEFDVPIEIPEGKTGAIYLGRYSQIRGEISGGGDLTVYCGGERNFLSSSKDGKNKMKLDNFTGNLTVAPNIGKHNGDSPYRGLLLETPNDFDTSTALSKVGVDSTFYDKKIMLKSGAGLTGCSGTRCFAIGELKAEDATSFLGGYGSGGSDGPRIYYMIGGLNTDVVLPLTIKNVGNKKDGDGNLKDYNYVGIIKVGTGTYTFTSTEGVATSCYGLQVWEGAGYVNIPVTETTTALGRVTKSNALTIYENAIGGGNGRLTGQVVVEGGVLEVGYHGIGELVLADIDEKDVASPLTINSGKVEFELSTAEKHDKLSTNRAATFKGNKIIVKMAGYYNIKDGDEFTILTSAQKTEGDTYEVVFENLPAGLTLAAREEAIDNGADKAAGYKIIIKATGNATGGKPGDEDPKVDDDPAQGIDATESANEVSIYPNPSNGEFYVEGENIESIQVYNNQGQLVTVETAATKVDLSGMAKGIYFAKIKVGNDVVVKKLVIK